MSRAQVLDRPVRPRPTRTTADGDEQPGRTRRAGRLLVTYLDVICGLSGAPAVTAAITILAGWPWALLTVGIALIVLAVML